MRVDAKVIGVWKNIF